MLSVQHNMLAGNASRQFKTNTRKGAKSIEKLSSGYKINRAADDAAGLAISEKMRRQIRGLTQASANAQDGISMVQTAEGALEEIHSMLHRGNELAVKAANGTLTDSDREMVDTEVQHLKKAINETANYTVFNELSLFPEKGMSPMSAMVMETYHYELSYNMTSDSFAIGTDYSGAGSMARAGGVISTGNALADKIANELLPNAIKQIFDNFPSLKTATGSDTIEMSLDVSFLDGPGNTLAYAQYSYSYGGGKAINMLVKVDTADFDEEDAAGTGSNAGVLESTLAHELMHTVMQYNLTDGMSGRTGDAYPTWFKEGTAQLSGGGYTTGWNSYLTYYAGKLSDENDSSQDANIANYLKKYTMSGRPYGHGYLGCAYLGYLANGGGAVTGANIAAGMDKIFSDLLSGDSLAAAIQKNTGLTESALEGLFANGDSNLVSFVRQLSYASKDGAGSVVTPSLGTGGTDILGNTAPIQAFYIGGTKVHVDASNKPPTISLQVGSEAGQHIDLTLYQMDAKALGLEDTNVKTIAAAGDAIEQIKNALNAVSKVRSSYGAVQNRLEHTIANLDNIVENTTASESTIRDTDIAEKMVEFSNNQILLQAGQSVLTQANHQPEMILSLLG
ncbi:MAG: flagellinolysin [Lachnospiraceae bacterium]|nr:flagellinolysin [Lachnospiraceae bacterium]